MPQYYFQKPENALKRASELLDVEKKADALDTLHDVIKSRRHRTWTKIHEQIMTKHLELCVELRKPHIAKDGLFQYRNMCQQVCRTLAMTIDDVIKSRRHRTWTKIHEQIMTKHLELCVELRKPHIAKDGLFQYRNMCQQVCRTLAMTIDDVTKSRRHRTWTKIHEQIMTKHLELCVELRKPHIAKDGLFQYRNMCQQVCRTLAMTIDDVIKSRRHRTWTKIHEQIMTKHLELCVELRKPHIAKDGLFQYRNMCQQVCRTLAMTIDDVTKSRRHRTWTKIHEQIMTKHLELCVELRKPHIAKDGLFQYRNMCQQVCRTLAMTIDDVTKSRRHRTWTKIHEQIMTKHLELCVELRKPHIAKDGLFQYRNMCQQVCRTLAMTIDDVTKSRRHRTWTKIHEQIMTKHLELCVELRKPHIAKDGLFQYRNMCQQVCRTLAMTIDDVTKSRRHRTWTKIHEQIMTKHLELCVELRKPHIAKDGLFQYRNMCQQVCRTLAMTIDDVIKSRRHRTWTKIHEQIMTKHLELCVELRKPHIAKDGLFQYRNMCQQVCRTLAMTIDDVIKSRRHRTWTKIHEQIMTKHLELCVELRKPHIAKDGLFQYRNMCQQVCRTLAMTIDDVTKSRRHRTWTKIHEQIMTKHLELCVELRKPHIAKDGLFQYRNMCQQVCRTLAMTIDDVTKSRRHRTWTKIHEQIMTKHLELCVELRKPHIAKDGLFQYRNMCQQGCRTLASNDDR